MNSDSLYTEELLADTFRTYADMIYRLAYARTKSKFDSDDILQEVFLRFINSDTKFISSEHAKAWFIKVTINCSNSFLKSTWNRKTTSMDILEDGSIAIEPKEKSDVYYAVLDLPLNYRTAIHLFYYEEYTTAEIAKLMNKKEGTVRSLLSRARDLLREKLKGVEFSV